MRLRSTFFLFFFFNDTATTEIYTLSLHDALPISGFGVPVTREARVATIAEAISAARELSYPVVLKALRSEEHTSELQSHLNLVCRLLLEKKKRTSAYKTRK